MYLKRKIDVALAAWADSHVRKPLVIRGARQVGKTVATSHLGSTKFQNYLAINFERQPSLKRVFESDLNPKRIVSELEALTETKIIPGQTLLFFDEIQDCPKAITALRYFYEELPDLHVVAAGSLLEFVWEHLSVPVGRISYLHLYPLSFAEFLDATDRSTLGQKIPRWTHESKEEMSIAEPVAIHLWAALKEYFLIGGMPEAVSAFAQRRSYIEVASIQDELLQTYRDDFHKYGKGEKQLENLSQIFSRLFGFVGRQIKYTELSQGDDIKRTRLSLELLEKAKVAHRVTATSGAGLPLSTHAKEKRFKCIFIDVGLGQRASGIKFSEVLNADNLLSQHLGALAEQFVGQELLANGNPTAPDALYYWTREEKSSSAEVDFLIVQDGRVIPLEVKSGSLGSLKSMHLFLKTYGGSGLCLRQTNLVKAVEQVTFAPLFVKV